MHKRAAARNAGGAQPRCYSTRRHDLQNAPGVVVNDATGDFTSPSLKNEVSTKHLGTRLPWHTATP